VKANIRGRQFGQLTVVRRSSTASDGSVIWLCRCRCKRMRKAVGCLLRNGKVDRCIGCRRSTRAGSWSATDEARLRELYPTTDTHELATLFGRTAKALASRAKVLGIRKAEGHGAKVVWTKQRDAVLRRLYPDQFAPAVAKAMCISVSSVYNRAFILGLKKSEKFREMQRRVEGERLKISGAAHRFRKGIVPHNKGLRRPGWYRGRMRETQFKKGAIPPNRRPMWSFCWMDGYLMLKTGKKHAPPMSGWEYVHKLIWERWKGPLPDWKEARLWWKDRDHANCALSNLELVSAQEHMARTTIHNFPPELKQVIQLTGALKRKIHNRQKGKPNGEEHDGRSAQSPVRCA
jgi:HNH endonuclease